MVYREATVTHNGRTVSEGTLRVLWHRVRNGLSWTQVAKRAKYRTVKAWYAAGLAARRKLILAGEYDAATPESFWWELVEERLQRNLKSNSGFRL